MKTRKWREDKKMGERRENREEDERGRRERKAREDGKRKKARGRKVSCYLGRILQPPPNCYTSPQRRRGRPALLLCASVHVTSAPSDSRFQKAT